MADSLPPADESPSPEESLRVLVASANHGKLEEIRSALAFPGWEFVTVADLGASAPHVVEDGGTFTDNALIKAYAYRDATGLPSLADDSGLVVDALGGEPGVLSSRYAGDDATDADNCRKLLEALEGMPPERRTAHFSCAIVYVDDLGMPTVAYGVCSGRIVEAPRGQGGFGYDPIFLPNEAAGRTMAELSLAEKNALSHRGRALRSLREEILQDA